MGLLGKKLAFYVLTSQHGIKAENEMMDTVRELKYEPLTGKKIERDCWVSPSAEIEEEFTQYVDNPGDAEAVMLQFLHAAKKANPKIVKRKFKKEKSR